MSKYAPVGNYCVILALGLDSHSNSQVFEDTAHPCAFSVERG